jgi:tetratricopeptide (TPR) repeat protein
MLKSTSIKIANKYFRIAFDSQMHGDIIEARSNYLASIEIHPTAEAFVNLGWTYGKENNYEDAIRFCHKALSLNPDYGMAYSDIGYYLFQTGEIDEAVFWLEEAVNMENFDGKFYAYYNLAKAYERKGEWIKAIKMFDKSLELKPGFKLGKKKLLTLSAKLN